MTTFCTLFGLLPLALGLGAGAELQRPLALAVIGGLALSTPVTLLVIPGLYSVIKRRQRPQVRRGGPSGPPAGGSKDPPLRTRRYLRSAAKATSGKSPKMPSTPREANWRYSLIGSPP